MSLSSPIALNDVDPVRWCKLQRFIRLAVDNAGISYTMSGFLTDINIGDNIAVRWAKLGAWMELLAGNIGGGGVPGAQSSDGGVVALALNDAAKAVVFGATFAAAPSVTGQVLLPNNTAAGISAWPDESTRTAIGVTFLFSDVIPAGTYKLAWQAVGV